MISGSPKQEPDHLGNMAPLWIKPLGIQTQEIFTTVLVCTLEKSAFMISSDVEPDFNPGSFQPVWIFWCRFVVGEVKHLPEN